MLQLRRERSGLSAEDPPNLSYCYYCSCSRDWPTFDGATESDKVYPVLFNVSTPATPATLATLHTECSHTPTDYAQLHQAYKSISILYLIFGVSFLTVVAMTATQETRETGCFGFTFERKYYRRDNAFIKRSLRPKEFRIGYRGLHIPRLGKERLINEAESLRYIRSHTNIPVPTVYCDFEDDDSHYLITEYIEGVAMASLPDNQKSLVCEELKGYLAELKALRSNRLGGPSGLVVPPYRVMRVTETDHWQLRPSEKTEYVFCHNDLSQHNVIVDPNTLKIKAIIDWEYAGFYPAGFEWPFYTRVGPSSAVNGEHDDSHDLLEFLQSQVTSQRTPS